MFERFCGCTGLDVSQDFFGVALGNVGDASALPALEAAARDPEPLIAEHARWAGAEIGRRAAQGA